MKVLVACEESQRVCTAFRELGHEAYSCDIQECSGWHPEWHIVEDALQLLNSQHKTDIYGRLSGVIDSYLGYNRAIVFSNHIGVFEISSIIPAEVN